MSGFAGIGATRSSPQQLAAFLGSTDLASAGPSREISIDGATLCVSAPTGYWLERRVLHAAGAQIAIAGNPVCARDIDWSALVGQLRAGRYQMLAELSGRFALAVLDAQEASLYLVTDRIGQYPLFLRPLAGGLVYSTSQASFCRLDEPLAIDESWVHEALLVNFPASHRSFLSGVRRMPAATVLRLHLVHGSSQEHAYAARFEPQAAVAPVTREIERGRALFEKRMPLFLRDGEQGLLGLSNGFDSRTLLAYFADHPALTAYTYGVPGCADLRGAAQIVRALGLHYRELPFDAAFTRELPQLAIDAVRLSSGLERAARATLPYVYRSLACGAGESRCILSGVSADQLFRGHGNVPSIVSDLMAGVFRTGDIASGAMAACARMFHEPARAAASLEELIAGLRARYGDLRQPGSHLGYMTYEVPSEYFSGEASIADHYADFRSPFCDVDLISFAHSTAISTLGFSKFARAQSDELRENQFPASLITSHPGLAGLPIVGKPTRVYARGNRMAFNLHRIRAGVRKRLAGQGPAPPLEDWKSWFRGPLAPLVAGLLGRDARIGGFLRREFIDGTLQSASPHWVNKLVTVELVLRLAELGWRPLDARGFMSVDAVSVDPVAG